LSTSDIYYYGITNINLKDSVIKIQKKKDKAEELPYNEFWEKPIFFYIYFWGRFWESWDVQMAEDFTVFIHRHLRLKRKRKA
jgi:hypothetical protein